MQWEADLLHAIQGVRNGFTDKFWTLVSFLGEEMFVIAVMMFVFWCVDKRKGFKFINIYFVSVAIVAGLKVLVHRVRPFNKYADNNYVQSIGEKSSDYCFPSGHTNSISTLSTLVVKEFPRARKFTLPVAIALVLLVMFSRMYLGQHYLTDVLTGACTGIAIVLALGFLYDLLKDREEYIAVVIVPLAIIASVFIGVFVKGEMLETSLTLTGIMTSAYIGYFIEKRVVKFNVKAALWQQAVKYVLGASVAGLLYFALGKLFAGDATMWLYGYIRYFLIGAWLMLGAPALFKLLGLENKNAERKESV